MRALLPEALQAPRGEGSGRPAGGGGASAAGGCSRGQSPVRGAAPAGCGAARERAAGGCRRGPTPGARVRGGSARAACPRQRSAAGGAGKGRRTPDAGPRRCERGAVVQLWLKAPGRGAESRAGAGPERAGERVGRLTVQAGGGAGVAAAVVPGRGGRAHTHPGARRAAAGRQLGRERGGCRPGRWPARRWGRGRRRGARPATPLLRPAGTAAPGGGAGQYAFSSLWVFTLQPWNVLSTYFQSCLPEYEG